MKYKGVYLKLNLETDKSVINKLENVNNKQGYIKDLIVADPNIYKFYRKEEINEQCNHHNS